MAGYVEKQVAAAQKTVADAIAGKQLKAAIKQLQEKSQIKDSLKTLPARGAITAKRNLAKRTGSTSGDFLEISRSFHTTLREIKSTCGIFTFEFYNVSTIKTDRATFSYLDFDPNA